MKNFVCYIFIFLAGVLSLEAQDDVEINWKTWPELEQAIKEKPKPIFIFFHAKWCAYCKKIERKIFTR